MRALVGAALMLGVVAQRALAQNEAALRAAFEGKMVTVRVDMPATSEGIDVYPRDTMRVNWRQMAQRFKDNGTSLKMGQQVMITKVAVKKDSHVEFQLGGGGYGTFADSWSSSSSVNARHLDESNAEKALRDSIKHAPGPTTRKRFERDLNTLRTQREQTNSNAEAEAAQANQLREANQRAKRAESGSRFNIRFHNGIPTDALTPVGVVDALREWVDFGAMASPAAGEEKGPSTPLTVLRKGLSLAEVESLLGPAAAAAEEKQGSVTVRKRTYRRDGMTIAASFVSDVLVDFAITPQ